MQASFPTGRDTLARDDGLARDAATTADGEPSAAPSRHRPSTRRSRALVYAVAMTSDHPHRPFPGIPSPIEGGRLPPRRSSNASRRAGTIAACLFAVLAGACTGDGALEPEEPARTAADAAALRASLSAAMSDHAPLPYGDAWDVLAEGAEVSPGAIRLFYTRRIVPSDARASGADQAEGDYWNREHVWPRSYGLEDADAETDVHNLVPVDRTVNSSRGNKVFDEADTPHHECAVCRVSGEAWEPAPEVQGDVARIAFYMDVRYEGGLTDDVPDLSLSDDPAPDAARFGVLSTLIDWHCRDPVSGEEVRRHEVAARAQGNRNAFVDAPELAGEIYGFECVDEA